MKDTTNLLDYNPYSAGEYSNDLSGIYRTNANHEIIISNEWSYIGETSFRIRSKSADATNFIINRASREINSVLTLQANIKVIRGTIQLRLQEISTNIMTDVNIPAGSTGEFTVSRTISSTQQVQATLLTRSADALFYIDNIRLTTR